MTAFVIKAASRTVLRRPQRLQGHNLISKRSPHTESAHSTIPRSTRAEDQVTATTIPVPSAVTTIPLWQRLGPLSRAFEAYGRSQRNRPYVTQFYSSLAIYLLGDMS